jgi:Tol biopolymer transport system component
MASAPAMAQQSIARIAMLPGGYNLVGMPDLPHSATPELSFAATSAGGWVEQAGHSSRIVSIGQRSETAIDGAYAPVLATDGQPLAYLREAKGRSRLYVRSKADRQTTSDMAWTPEWMNVEEASFLPDASLIVAAAEDRGGSRLYRFHSPMQGAPLDLGDARYPAASPDGHWLAYSAFSSGAWNLWLLDRVTGNKRRLTGAACNQIEPAWEPDSKTLLYASDCGRALWFTAICRRRVIP